MRRGPIVGTLLAVALASSPAAGDDAPGAPSGAPVTENRLARERSPYLRQHRTNPVDWYPWGAEALERARREGRPLFVSVGYSACHWCHVMEHESFEDAETARLLNETFVCVKVDREERPDLDRVYMTAVQLLTGRGGWPMTVLLTPEGLPFFGGTYLPPEAVRELTRRVREVWAAERGALEQQARSIAARVAAMTAGPALPPTAASDADLVRGAVGALGAVFDAEHGGYGDRPKFPPHAELLFLLDRGGANGGAEGVDQARRTLVAMEEGGLHDHVGGGFHRYSTDERWLLPHFEKMLYDNALLAQAYARAWQVTGEPRFARVARRTLEWVRRDLARPSGGYASSLDADTDGHEGLTYTWTVAEVRAALAPEDAALALRVLGPTEAGNVEEEATGRRTGRNVLHLPVPLDEAARREGTSPEALGARLDGILARLRDARAGRAQPGLDDKVLVAWNGLLLSAFAVAGATLPEPAYLEEGRRLARHLLDRCRTPEGTLLRFPRGSGPEIPGFCEDHVHLAEGLLDLADATGEAAWADAAADLLRRLVSEFEDAEAGGFWATSATRHETLFARSKEAWDSPIPSDQGVAARALLRLAARTGDARAAAAAERTLVAYRPLLAHAGAARGVVALLRALADREAGGGVAGGPSAGDASGRADGIAVDAFLERNESRRGGRIGLAIRVRVPDGWHVNAAVPSSPDLVATRLALREPAPVGLVEVSYPVPRSLEAGGLPSIDVLDGTFWVRGVLEVPSEAPLGPRRIGLVLSLQACDRASCRPPAEVYLDVPLRFAAEDGAPRHAAVFGRAVFDR